MAEKRFGDGGSIPGAFELAAEQETEEQIVDNADAAYSEVGSWTDITGNVADILDDWLLGQTRSPSAGTDRRGLVVFSLEALPGTSTFTSATWGGRTLTVLYNELTADAAKENRLVVCELSEAEIAQMSGGAIVITGTAPESIATAVYDNVYQTAPFPSSSDQQNNGIVQFITCPAMITVSSNDSAFQVFCTGGSYPGGVGITHTLGFVEKIDDQTSEQALGLAHLPPGNPGTPTCSVTWDEDQWRPQIYATSIEGSLGASDAYLSGARLADAGAGDAVANFVFTIPATTEITIYAWWPTISGADNATAFSLSGTHTGSDTVDQSANPGQWNQIFNQTVDACDGELTVTITNTVGGIALADAIKIEYLANPNQLVCSSPASAGAGIGKPLIAAGTDFSVVDVDDAGYSEVGAAWNDADIHAIEIDSVGAAHTLSVTDATSWAHTCSNADKLLVKIAVWNAASTFFVQSITYAGQTMTLLDDTELDDSGVIWNALIYYLDNPPNGTADISIVFSTDVSNGIVNATSIRNAQDGAAEGSDGDSMVLADSRTTLTATITATLGAILFDVLTYEVNSPIAPGGSQIEEFDEGNSIRGGGSRLIAPAAGSQQMSYSVSSAAAATYTAISLPAVPVGDAYSSVAKYRPSGAGSNRARFSFPLNATTRIEVLIRYPTFAGTGTVVRVDLSGPISTTFNIDQTASPGEWTQIYVSTGTFNAGTLLVDIVDVANGNVLADAVAVVYTEGVAGSVIVQPDLANADSSAAMGSVVQGSINITPISAASVAASVDPSVGFYTGLVNPQAAAAVGASIFPTVLIGSAVVTAAPAAAVAASISPSVRTVETLSGAANAASDLTMDLEQPQAYEESSVRRRKVGD